MATVVQGGDSVFRNMLYGAPTQQAIEFVKDQVQQFTAAVGNAAPLLLTKVQEQFNAHYSEDALNAAKATMRRVQSMWMTDSIRPLTRLEQFQTATPVMSRWLMAEPTVRKMYHQGQVDGFSDTYFDAEYKQVGDEHTDYRRVNNGFVHFDDETDEISWTQYFDDDEDYDLNDDLSLSEQDDIQLSWKEMKAIIKQEGVDPTNRFTTKI